MPKLETVIKFDLQSWPYLHSSMSPDAVLEFYGPDCEDVFSRNLKYMPDDWIFRNKKITYNFNDVGLRMKKNIDQIKNDFIYFSGTSFTMGIGISEEDRFSDIISKQLSLDYINYAGPTYSVKLQVHSFFNFIKDFNKPKILVIEYPPSSGYTFLEDKKAITYYSKHTPDTRYNDVYTKLLATDFLKNEAAVYRNMLQVICKEAGIKIIEISFNKDDPFVNDNFIIVDQDIIDNNNINFRFGRDIIKQNGYYSGHPGIGIHNHVADEILRKLK